MSEQKSGLNIVLERNTWALERYRMVLRTLAGSILLNLILAAGLSWFVFNPPKPLYFATDVQGRILPLAPLHDPMVTVDTLQQWVADKAVKSYTLDFVHWQSQLTGMRQYFSERGYKAWLTALNQSKLIEIIKKEELTVSAAYKAPTITASGVMSDGVYGWWVEVPLTVTYQTRNTKKYQNLIVKMLIKRVDTRVRPDGLVIDLYAGSAK